MRQLIIILLLFGGFAVALWAGVIASLHEGLEQQRVASKNPPAHYLPATAVVASVHDVRIDYGMYEYICEYYYIVDSIKYWDQAPCCGLSEGDTFSVKYDASEPGRDYIVPPLCWEQSWGLPVLTALWMCISAVWYSRFALAALGSLAYELREHLKTTDAHIN